MQEKPANVATRRLLLTVPQQCSQSKCRICISPLQYRSKVSYHRLARHVSFETRCVSFLASALEVLILCFRRYLNLFCVLLYPFARQARFFILICDVCVCDACVYYKNLFLPLQAGNFLRLLAFACSWILQGTRTSSQQEVKNDITSLRLEVKNGRTSLH